MVRLRYRVNKNNVAILSHEEIDDHVAMLLSEYNPELLEKPQPLDVEDFAESYLGLDFDYADLSFNGCYWGMMVFNNRCIPVYNYETGKFRHRPVNAGTIVIDNSLLDENMEVCLRSTTAHECGHHLYDGQYYWEDDDQISFFDNDPTSKVAPNVCRKSDIQGSEKKKLETDKDHIEHHAKYFSASLLMNKRVMMNYYGNPAWRKAFLEENRSFTDTMLAYEVAETFNVSVTSAKIRLNQLGLTYEQEGVDYIRLKRN